MIARHSYMDSFMVNLPNCCVQSSKKWHFSDPRSPVELRLISCSSRRGRLHRFLLKKPTVIWKEVTKELFCVGKNWELSHLTPQPCPPVGLFLFWIILCVSTFSLKHFLACRALSFAELVSAEASNWTLLWGLFQKYACYHSTCFPSSNALFGPALTLGSNENKKPGPSKHFIIAPHLNNQRPVLQHPHIVPASTFNCATSPIP